MHFGFIEWLSRLGMYPYWLVFGKSCHFPIELEYRSYWDLKKLNLSMEVMRKKENASIA